ncbi:hypothetical protein ACW2Q0_21230 [Nocardia sp. R16R-3T]
MPKSKGRKPKRTNGARKPSRGRTGYNPGRLGIPEQVIATMLGTAPPDQLVEMLPPFLWLHHSSGHQANMCVSAALTLQQAYDVIGVLARPTAVQLVISHRDRGPLTRYGGGEHHWDGKDYSGHCVLYLPGSGRWIDTTVMQYPEARASMPLPIVGRPGGVLAGGERARAALAEGRLLVGTRMTVPREELILDYTVVAEDDEMITTGAYALAPDGETRLRNAGVNLASAAIEWWRRPGIVERVRDAPYPRLHALLDAVGQAPTHIDEQQDCFFEIAPGQHVRLDELLTTR